MRRTTSAARRGETVAQAFASRRAFMLVHGRRAPKPGKPRRLLQPDAIRLAYFRLLLAVVEHARQLFERRGLPIARMALEKHAAELAKHDAAVPGLPIGRGDAGEDDLAAAFDDMAGEMFDTFTNAKIADDIQGIGQRTADFHKEQFAAQMKGALGIDIVKAEPWLEPRIAAFTKENVALVRSIPTEYYNDLEKRVTRAMREGLRWEELADEISSRYDIAEGRAKLIARDQVGKWMGELNSVRQQEVGVTSFVWRTAKDNRVRESHAELEGETFEWSDPPDVDGEPSIPGEPFNCRCEAEPVLDDLIDAASAGEEGDQGDEERTDYDPDEPRDEHGRWTSKGGGVEAAVERTAQASPDLYRKALAEAGFTYDVVHGTFPDRGYAVSTHPEHEKAIRGDVTPRDISGYVEDHAQAFRDPEARLGAWHDAEKGKWYLDVVSVTNDRERAVQLAHEHGQEGIYDLSAHETIITKEASARRDAVPGRVLVLLNPRRQTAAVMAWILRVAGVVRA